MCLFSGVIFSRICKSVLARIFHSGNLICCWYAKIQMFLFFQTLLHQFETQITITSPWHHQSYLLRPLQGHRHKSCVCVRGDSVSLLWVHEAELIFLRTDMMRQRQQRLTFCFYSHSSRSQHCPTYTLQLLPDLQRHTHTHTFTHTHTHVHSSICVRIPKMHSPPLQKLYDDTFTQTLQTDQTCAHRHTCMTPTSPVYRENCCQDRQTDRDRQWEMSAVLNFITVHNLTNVPEVRNPKRRKSSQNFSKFSTGVISKYEMHLKKYHIIQLQFK